MRRLLLPAGTLLIAWATASLAQPTALPSDLGATAHQSAPPQNLHAQPPPPPSPTPGPGEFSIKNDTSAILDPKKTPPSQQGGAAVWLAMKLLYSDQPSPGTQEIVAAWQLTKHGVFKGSQGSPVLYQDYVLPDRRVVVLIGYTPDCRTQTLVKMPGSKLTSCPLNVYINYHDRPPRMIGGHTACFQWNGQAAPGSRLDPRTNSDYSLFDPSTGQLKIYSIKDGVPYGSCSVTIDLSDQTDTSTRQ